MVSFLKIAGDKDEAQLSLCTDKEIGVFDLSLSNFRKPISVIKILSGTSLSLSQGKKPDEVTIKHKGDSVFKVGIGYLQEEFCLSVDAVVKVLTAMPDMKLQSVRVMASPTGATIQLRDDNLKYNIELARMTSAKR
jgi:hypothetical protein